MKRSRLIEGESKEDRKKRMNRIRQMRFRMRQRKKQALENRVEE